MRWLTRGRVLLFVFELCKEIEQFLRHQGSGISGHFENNEFVMTLAYFADIFSHLNDLKTSIQGTAMNMIRARESLQYLPSLINFQSESVALNQATILIFYNLMKFRREKYRYSLSLKCKIICRSYGTPSKDTFIQERFLIHRVECSMQDPVIFNLKSTVWMTMMS